MDKESLRKGLKFARSALNKRYIKNRGLIASLKIRKLLGNNVRIATYYPFNNEIDPNGHLKYFKLLYPKIKDNNMFFCYEYSGFKKGYGSIKEPFGNYMKLKKRDIDCIIVPAVAYDVRGFRIGYGKGFYDRFLKNFKGLKIGVTFDCCILDKIENDWHDVPVDIVVTPKRNIICKLRR